MFENILLAYDHSEHAQRAAELAGKLARQQAAPRLRIITIVEPVSAELGEPYFSQTIEKRKAAGEEILQEAIRLIGEGIEITPAVLFGRTAEAIAEVAETRQCDLVVIGSRGRGSTAARLLGSQAQKVISLVNCPVLVTK